jgi:hypothetical protein
MIKEEIPSHTTSANPQSPAPSGVGGVESSIRLALHKTPSRIEFVKDSWNYIQSTRAYEWISPLFIQLWHLGCQIVWTAREIAFSPQRSPTSLPSDRGKDIKPQK